VFLNTTPSLAHIGHDHGSAPEIHDREELKQLDSNLALRLEQIVQESDLRSYEQLVSEVEKIAHELQDLEPGRSKTGESGKHFHRTKKLFSTAGKILKSFASRLVGIFRPSKWKETYYHYMPKLAIYHGALLGTWEAAIEPSLPVHVGHSHGVEWGLATGVLSLVHALDGAVYPLIYHLPKTAFELHRIAALGGVQSAITYFSSQAGVVPFTFDSLKAVLWHVPSGGSLPQWIAVIQERPVIEKLTPKALKTEQTARRGVVPTVSLAELERMAHENSLEIGGLKTLARGSRLYAFGLAQLLQTDSRTSFLLAALLDQKIADSERLRLSTHHTDVSAPIAVLPPVTRILSSDLPTFWELTDKHGLANVARMALAHFRIRAERILVHRSHLGSIFGETSRAFVRASRELHTPRSLLVRSTVHRGSATAEQVVDLQRTIARIDHWLRRAEQALAEAGAPTCATMLSGGAPPL